MKLKFTERSHTYTVDGVRWSSVSSVAKTLEDGYRLQKWQQRMVAIGVASDPHLAELVCAHFDDRDMLDDLCEKAANAAGAHKAAERGTAIHRITERVDAGTALIRTALSEQVAEKWNRIKKATGIEIAYDSQGRMLSERIVLYPEHHVCGKFDRVIGFLDGRLAIADTKSGLNAISYPHSIAIQLAMYANAPLIAAPLPPDGGVTEEFEDFQAMGIDLSTALVIHMPDGEHVAVHEFDIAAGYEAARLCFQALAWRKRKELCRPLDTEENDGREPVGATTSVDVGAVSNPLAKPDEEAAENRGHEIRPVEADRPAATSPEALAAAIRALPAERQEFMKQRWPIGTPTPGHVVRRTATWTAEQVDAVRMLVEQASWACDETPEEQEAQDATQRQAREELVGIRTDTPTDRMARMGTGDPHGQCATVPSAGDGRGPEGPHRSVPRPDESEAADPDAVAALVAQLKALDEERTKITSRWVNEAYQAGVPFGQITTNPTRRRFAIARAALALAEHMDGDDELVRMALALVLGDDAVQPAFTTGALLGSLTPEEADRLTDVAEVYPDRYCVRFEGEVGRLVVVG